MYLTEAYVRNLFAPRIYARGLSYYREGTVDLIEFDDDYLEAEVHGTEVYSVQVEEKSKGLAYFCTCPYSGPCKHVAATLLAAMHADGDPQVDLSHPQVATPSWQRYLTQLNETDLVQPGEEEWRVFYAIRLERDRWWLHPQKRKVLKDGSLGRIQAISSTDFKKSWVVPEQEDKLILSFLEKWRLSHESHYYYYYTVRATKYDFEYGAAAGLVFTLMRERALFLQKEEQHMPLELCADPVKLEFRLLEHGNELRFCPFLLLDNRDVLLKGNFVILTTNPVWILFEDKVVEISGRLRAQSLLPFARPHYEVIITKEQLPQFFQSLSSLTDVFELFRFPEDVRTESVSDITERRLYLTEQRDGVCVHLKFAYGPVEIDMNDRQQIGWGMNEAHDAYIQVMRDSKAEAAALERLMKTNLKRSAGGQIRTYKNKGFVWLLKDVPELLKDGFVVFGEESLRKFKVTRSSAQVRVQIESGIDWFDLEFAIDFDGISLSLQEVKKALRKKTQYVRLADGSMAALPKTWLNKFRHTINLGEETGNHVRLSHFHVTLIDELFAAAQNKQEDTSFQQRLARLRDFDGIREQPVPVSLQGQLRPYQKEGVDWLHFLCDYQFGGCLADDMGLGKTIQALTILLAEAERGATKPSLIVTPTSVIFNWMNEIARFAPRLRVLNQTGSERQRVDVKYEEYDVVLTSYGTLRQDIVFLKDVQFNFVILDESQNIKNPLSQTAKAAKLLNARHRLALTGTPIENNTIELWSLFSFLNPGLLGNLNYFKEAFAKPIEKEGDEVTARLLRKTIFPFILRRTKDKVAKELPPKVENLVYAEMTAAQEKVYNKWRDTYRAALLKQIADVGLNKSRMNVLQGLTKLRQIACHPLLVEDSFAGGVGKYDTVLEYIEEITAEGHKILVFSQFVKMLTIMRRYLDSARVPYAYLDGKTRDRQACVEQFEQDRECKIFLISLKAGGTGLNLTAADYVIHYDPWWNPAVEAQATDRSHRIGQDKHVFVYKIISKGTVEEKILQLQERKKELVSNIITTDDGVFKRLTVADIEDLFS